MHPRDDPAPARSQDEVADHGDENLPAVRQASQDMVVVADGFSCKTQLQQAAVGRRALHVAQVIKLAREHGPIGWTPGPPEESCSDDHPPAPSDLRWARFAALAGALVLVTVAAAGLLSRGKR